MSLVFAVYLVRVCVCVRALAPLIGHRNPSCSIPPPPPPPVPLQACLRACELEGAALFTGGFVPCTALALVAGSCIIQYTANVITASGIGNGSTLVICTGIVTGACWVLLFRMCSGCVI